MSLNRAQIMGNLGADPDTKYLPSGDTVTNLSIATTDKWKDKQTGEQKERTEWHRVSFFGRKAEVIAEYFRKGDQIYIEGSLQTRKYEKDGVTHYATEIKGREFQFCGDTSGSKGSTSESQAAPPAATGDSAQGKFDDDIPF